MSNQHDVDKVVLAYSGGLDTSIILRWLEETYGCEVVTFTADLGQGGELEPARAKAEAMGIHTLRYKLIAWAMAAFFVGLAGGISAFQLIHFEPLETAYPTIVHSLWLYHGDVRVVRRHWASLQRYMAFWRGKHANDGGLAKCCIGFGDWVPPPQPPGPSRVKILQNTFVD